MKSLKSILEASILADIDDQLEAGDEAIKKQIEEFINHNYDITERLTISDNPNKDGKYEVSSTRDVIVKDAKITLMTSLTNNMFVWSNVKGDFNCRNCSNLKSLEGAPQKIGKDFYCRGCSSLTSLEGAPQKIGEFFDCSSCESLESLAGAPKKINSIFDCRDCSNLKSLEGAPQKIGKDFYCRGCSSLTSLEGAPKEVGGVFNCCDCKVQFTKADVEKASNVKGKIFC